MRRFHSTALTFLGLVSFVYGSDANAQEFAYSVRAVKHLDLVANLYLPKSTKPIPAVIAFGGSDGGLNFGEANGKMIAPNGIAVLSLSYFKSEGLPQTLDQIPLEYFIKAVDFLIAQPEIDAKHIGVVSGSRGSEAALLLASYDNRIRAVVVTTPSNVVWGGMSANKSAWTYKGKDLPFLGVSTSGTQPQIERFSAALAVESKADLARIPIERINGPIYFISAKNDQIWPSYNMSVAMEAYLQQHNFPFSVSHSSYATGHGFSQATAPEIKQSIIDYLRRILIEPTSP